MMNVKDTRLILQACKSIQRSTEWIKMAHMTDIELVHFEIINGSKAVH
jgi:hypothetical protein